LIFNKEFLKISWKILGYIGKTTYLYSVIKMIDMYNENTFKNFSASKMSYNPRFSVSVEYTDFMGKTHRIECKSRKALNEAREFLSLFKSESAKVNAILREYPVKMGKFPKKFHKEIKAELAEAGFGTCSKFLLA
jgi:hypothetical protein